MNSSLPGCKKVRCGSSTDPKTACAEAGRAVALLDTPVNDNDESDVEFVLEKLRRCLPHLPDGALVLISSQLPVGTCAVWKKNFHNFILPVRRKICASAKPSKLLKKRIASLLAFATRRRSARVGTTLQTFHGAGAFHAHRVRGNGEACAQFVSRRAASRSSTRSRGSANTWARTRRKFPSVSRANLASGRARILARAVLSLAARWRAMLSRSRNWARRKANRSHSFQPSNRATTSIAAGCCGRSKRASVI